MEREQQRTSAQHTSEKSLLHRQLNLKSALDTLEAIPPARAAQFLGTSRRTIYCLLATGELERWHMHKKRQRRSSLDGAADLRARSRPRSAGRGTPESARPQDRFANPWSFRRQESIERAAGLDGRPLAGAPYRRNGRLQHGGHFDDPLVREQPARSAADESHLPYLYRLRDACMARYRSEGRCTHVELKTMHKLWVDNLTLHELARQEGVKPQAISSRINGLANKALEFYRWWRGKNLSHQGRRRRT